MPIALGTNSHGSQGAAVMTGAISGLSSAVRDKIVGTVLYGDTRNQQTGGTIPNYAQEDLLIICNPGDPVCKGILIVTAAHLSYVPTVPEAVSFLEGRINSV